MSYILLWAVLLRRAVFARLGKANKITNNY